jgi:protoheme IX farnesyltransferase
MTPKVTASAPSLPLAGSPARQGTAILGEYWELTKPRLSFLSVLTAVVGYLVAHPERNFVVLACLLVGTTSAAFGAGVLNQWIERTLDARMARTRGRPLPSGTVTPGAALAFGLVLSLFGPALLYWGVNTLAAALAAATLLSYLFVYTPLKRHTPWCTIVGSIPGALPPLIGAAAATGTIKPLGWILFGILFTWQIPHFLALAWTYRRDYAAARLPMSTVVDPTGRRAARDTVLFTIALVVCSLLPVALGFASLFYGLVAAVAGGWFLRRAWAFARAPESERDAPARRLFLASIAYLPLTLFVLVADRLLG